MTEIRNRRTTKEKPLTGIGDLGNLVGVEAIPALPSTGKDELRHVSGNEKNKGSEHEAYWNDRRCLAMVSDADLESERDTYINEVDECISNIAIVCEI